MIFCYGQDVLLVPIKFLFVLSVLLLSFFKKRYLVSFKQGDLFAVIYFALIDGLTACHFLCSLTQT